MGDYYDSVEMLKDFYLEAEQQVEKLEQNILAIENDSSDKDAIDEIFRAAHTLKGGAATVQMMELSEFTHAIEDLLDAIRSGSCGTTSEIIDCLLQGLDVIKAMLTERKNGSIYNKNEDALKAKLRSYVHTGGATPKKVMEITASSPNDRTDISQSTIANSGPSAPISSDDLAEMLEVAGEVPVCRVRVEFDETNPMNSVGGIQVFSALKNIGQILRTFPDFDSLYEDHFYNYVDYYLASVAELSKIKGLATLSEVTLRVSTYYISELEIDHSNISDHDSEVMARSVVTKNTPLLLEGVLPLDKSKPNSSLSTVKRNSTALSSKKEAATQILRVDSRRIDRLLNLVSEIVITKGAFNQVVGHLGASISDFNQVKLNYNSSIKALVEQIPDLMANIESSKTTVKEIRKIIYATLSPVQSSYDLFEANLKNGLGKIKSVATDLSRTTGELHEGVLKIRMVPVDQVFQRFPRLVRDLTKSLNKEVHLEIIGGDTEMDKTVTEELFDPLMHCVRNSMDHGIEIPDERELRGKKREGLLVLRASNQGSMVVIEIKDDGNGIDVELVKSKAVERGLIVANKKISDQEAFNLIMEPGFSTAKAVTDLSGRGVGLDVVKKSIEKLNGEITIWSEQGVGSTFTIKLPLTLAIIQGLMVRVATNIYVIPITSVLESFRVAPNEIRVLDNYEVFNVRDDVISILRLSNLFAIEADLHQEYNFIVVVGTEDKKIGLMVDALIGEEDVVIKPLKDQYSNSPGLAGATILGDGTVSLIVDVGQLLSLGLKKEQLHRNQYLQGEH